MTLLVSGTSTAASALPTAAEPRCYSRAVNEWWCTDYLVDRRPELVDATVEHLWITFTAVALAVLVAFPMALLARRHPRLESTVLGASTGLYTIPSLALFPLLVPFTGITATTVVIGLALYALTILVRSMLDGLKSVPDDVRESADGLGYSPTSRLLKVELPLALPVMMGGLRVATVSTVALTTVGALV
ncbi:MAG: ABC transporter permease, partial [Nocardioides sp.]|nr:ABC transporter permease [Nocardioides sp.]